MNRSNNHSEKKQKQEWKTRVTRAAEYSGSMREFCQAEGISMSTFQYWRQKLVREKADHAMTTQPFARIQVETPVVESQSNFGLPDPRWVAELILHLQKSNR